MHGDLVFRGWFVTLMYVVVVLLWLGAVAVIVDCLRRPSSEFGALGRGPWVVLQSVFVVVSTFGFAASLLGFSKALPPAFAAALGALMILAAIQQVAYLLRVVFPSPARLSARAARLAGPPPASVSMASPESHGIEE